MNEMEHRKAVVDEALTWLNTPYHHMGRVKGAGTDCGMLLLEVFERCGLIPRIEVPYYPMDWALHRSEEKYLGWVKQYAHEVTRPPLPGDVVLYKFGRCISHGAIVTAWPQIIHANRRTGGVTLADAGEFADRQAGVYTLNSWE